jgi:sugar phosphate isomerase/epimerase
MKFAVCNETFVDWPFEKAFAFAAECGYTGLEMAPFTMSNYVFDISGQERDRVRRLAEKAGLEILGLHWLLAKTEGYHLTSPDAAQRRVTADYLEQLIRFCADLGGHVMVFGSPRQRDLLPGVSHEEATRYALDVFTSLVPVLERNGVVLALEPLGPKETTFMVTAEETAALVKRIDSPHVRMILDVKAMASEDVPIPTLITRHADMLVHFHANDANLQGPGFGDTDFVPIFRALRQIDYDGWVSVEVFDYTPGVERLARESIRYMKKCLAEVDAAD